MKDIKRGDKVSYLTFPGFIHFLDGLPISKNDLTTGVVSRVLSYAGKDMWVVIKEDMTGRTYPIITKRIVAVLDE